MSDQQIIEIVDSLIPEGLKLLETIVNINSYSANPEGNNAVLDVLAPAFTALGMSVERVPCRQAGDVLIARTARAGSNDILLSGHCDTVFPPHSEFQSMRYEGDRVIGPGVCDMKGGLVCILLVLQTLKKLQALEQLPLRVLIGSDEEIGSIYSQSTYAAQAAYIDKALVFETGKANNTVVTSRVGSRSFRLEVFGKAAHAGSAFEKGANAITRAAYIVNELRQLTDLDQGLTCNVGVLRGGEATNVVPEYVECRFEIRAEKLQILEEATRKIHELLKREEVPGTRVTLEVLYSSMPFERTTAVEELFRSYQRAGARAGMQYHTNINPIRGGSDANFFASQGIPTIDALGPFGEEHHSSNEFMELASLKPKTLNCVYWLLEQR